MEIAGDNAFATSYYNITGGQQNHKIPFTHQPTHGKKLRDFFMKNAVFKQFMLDIDKKDERFIMNEVQVQSLKPGDRIVRNDARERALFIVVSGKVFGLRGFDYYTMAGGHEPIVYTAGAVVGCKEFLNDDKWGVDLICQGIEQEETLVAKLDYGAFLKLKEQQPVSAAKLRNRVMRQIVADLIYERKGQGYLSDSIKKHMSSMEIDEKSLLIDLRIGNDKKALENLFEANMESIAVGNENARLRKEANDQSKSKENTMLSIRQQASRGVFGQPEQLELGKAVDVAKDLNAGNIKSRDEMKYRAGLGGYVAPERKHIKEDETVMDKADQHAMIPLFLAAEYREAFDKSYNKREASPDGDAGEGTDDDGEKADAKKKPKQSKNYKSQFIVKKIADQSERAKKLKRDGRQKAAGGVGGGAKRKGKEKTVAEETAELHELVEELRSEAQFRDEEFGEMQKELDRLRKQNGHLRSANKQAVVRTQLLESAKTQEAVMKELLENARTIQDGSFFDLKRDDGKSTTSTLLSQLVEQKRNTHKMALARKYGEKWLMKTREARQRREDERVRLFDQ